MISPCHTLLFACLITLDTAAQEARERSDLGLVQRQITIIEQLTERARSGVPDTESSRYHFDYQRFAEDLKRMRQGINKYLSPSRAQPADLIELKDDYRAEVLQQSTSHEYD